MCKNTLKKSEKYVKTGLEKLEKGVMLKNFSFQPVYSNFLHITGRTGKEFEKIVMGAL